MTNRQNSKVSSIYLFGHFKGIQELTTCFPQKSVQHCIERSVKVMLITLLLRNLSVKWELPCARSPTGFTSSSHMVASHVPNCSIIQVSLYNWHYAVVLWCTQTRARLRSNPGLESLWPLPLIYSLDWASIFDEENPVMLCAQGRSPSIFPFSNTSWQQLELKVKRAHPKSFTRPLEDAVIVPSSSTVYSAEMLSWRKRPSGSFLARAYHFPAY